MNSVQAEFAITKSAGLKAYKEYITFREKQRLVQFLVAPCSDFEELKGSILHYIPLPLVDSVVCKHVAEETHLKSLAGEVSLPPSSTSVLAVPSRLFTQNQNKGYVRAATDECIFFKQKGHWKS